MFSDITISEAAAWIVAAATGLVAIAKAWELIQKRQHPESDLRIAVQRIQETLDSNTSRLDKNDDDMDDVHNGISIICQTELAILNHLISGNDVERLRVARERLNEYLANR